MKAKNILMSVLLAMGFIAAKAAGYPPELALVSQPVMVYNYNSITVYYDVQNIGDYTYRGDICLYLSPNNGYCYAEKYVKVCPGRIKRVAIDIPAYRPNPSYTYTIMPYYELGDELYSFTTFEYFEPLCFHWNGYHNEPWVVINVPPRPHYYTRPGNYRYYYDGFRPPMPPPPGGPGHGPGTLPPPMDPMHHTYGYHHNNGGYPTHNNWNNTPPPAPNGNANPPAPNNGGSNNGGASVRPKDNAGSMSHGNVNAGNNNGGNTPPPPPPSNNSNNGSNSGASTSSSSGRTGNSGNVSRPNNNTNNGNVNSGSSSGRTGNSGNVNRPNNNTGSNSGTNNSNSGRTENSGSNVRNGSSTGSATSGTSSGSNPRSGSKSTNTRSGNNSGRGSR